MHIWNLWGSVPPTRLRTSATEFLLFASLHNSKVSNLQKSLWVCLFYKKFRVCIFLIIIDKSFDEYRTFLQQPNLSIQEYSRKKSLLMCNIWPSVLAVPRAKSAILLKDFLARIQASASHKQPVKKEYWRPSK